MSKTREPPPSRTSGAAFAAEPEFAEAATRVLGALRSSCSALVSALPGVPRRPTDLAKALRVDAKLAWAVFNLATAASPLDSGAFVPGRGPMGKVLRAAASRGVSEETTRRVQEAFDQFEDLVDRHAGDRASFESMISDLTNDGVGGVDLSQKRAGFRVNRHLWGVQVRTRLTCRVVHPSERPGILDEVHIRGMMGIKQLRRTRAMHATFGTKHLQTASPDEMQTVPLDLEHKIGDGPFSLFPQFSHHPLPQFKSVKDAAGFNTVEVVSRGVGNLTAFTFFVGVVVRNSDLRMLGSAKGPRWQGIINLPTETHVEDLLVHEDVWSGPPPEVRVYGTLARMPGVAVHTPREEDLLPAQESIAELGRGVEALETPDVPRYSELMRDALNRVGWDPGRFRVFRCRIEYPILFSLVQIAFPIQD